MTVTLILIQNSSSSSSSRVPTRRSSNIAPLTLFRWIPWATLDAILLCWGCCFRLFPGEIVWRWLIDIFLLDDSWTPVPDAIELYGNINNLQFSYADMNGPSSTARGLDNVRSSSSCTFLLQKTKSRHLICFFAICGGQHPVLSITLLLVVTALRCNVTMFFYC